MRFGRAQIGTTEENKTVSIKTIHQRALSASGIADSAWRRRRWEEEEGGGGGDVGNMCASAGAAAAPQHRCMVRCLHNTWTTFPMRSRQPSDTINHSAS
jgi:hypothetical protein